MKNIILFWAVVLLSVINLCAQNIITDRPDQTESSSTVPKGSIQIESGIFLGFIDNEGATERQFLSPSNLFRIGILSGLELRVVNQLESLVNNPGDHKTNGISDLEIGTKFQILHNENSNTEIAFLSHLVLPTGTKGISSNTWGSINKLSISHAIDEKIGLGYNIGYNNFGKNGDAFTYSLALGIGITNEVGLYIEPYGEFLNFEDHIMNFDSGMTYLISNNFQLDFSFGSGINHNMNYIALGLSWLIHD